MNSSTSSEANSSLFSSQPTDKGLLGASPAKMVSSQGRVERSLRPLCRPPIHESLHGLEANPSSISSTVQTCIEQATNYLQQAKPQQAILCYQKAAQLAPQNPLIFHQWGDTLFNLKQWNEAIAKYCCAIALNPKFDWSYYNLGEALARLEHWQEAVVAYQQAYDLNPRLPSIHQKLADAFYYRAVAESERLLAICQQEIEANPHNVDTYYHAIELHPQNAELYRGLGKALTANNRLAEAIIAYQMLLQIKPDDTAAQSELDKILKRQQNGQPNIDNTIKEEFSPAAKLHRAKQILENLNEIALDNFLLTEARLCLPKVEQPQVSIILILYNRAELTLSCLTSILSNSFKSVEVVIVDNCSTDLTRQLLKRVEGAKIILNEENKHFLLACNQASQVATGEYLLFLNNDAQILGDSINAAVQTIKSTADVGAVGGKIILPDGTLQEAGSIIWRDGSCLGYGRGDDPKAPQYMFKRSVDYCSGAFLLTERKLFDALGGFDRAYQPAYYEETDYCLKLHKAGKKIIYDPNVVILHYEFASSPQQDQAIALQKRNQQIFVKKHRDWLQTQYAPDLKRILFARTAKSKCQRILFIDDRIPHPYLGSGYTRSHSILKRMVNLGYFVTFYPSDLSRTEAWQDTYRDINQTVEVMKGCGLAGVAEFLRARKGYYDIIFVSRPHNMNHLNYLLSQEGNLLSKVKIIYDAEALYSLRELEQKRLQGKTCSEAEKEKLIANELKLARHSDRIVAVSAQEQQRFLDYGYEQVSILGHALEAVSTPNNFNQRQHILFVGSVYELESPNADSIFWLSKEIFPLIQQQLGTEVNLLIAGNNTVAAVTQQIKQLHNNSLKMLGRVDSLSSLYNQARLFVAPTRFAAGIPHKVHEAAAYGLPIVTTSLIASQLQWKHEIDLLVADSSEDFAQQCLRLYQDEQLWRTLRLNALKRVESQCSPNQFTATLKQILM